jgi:hypothetical protein
MQPQVPTQGGKGTYTANTIGPDGRPIGADKANQYNAAKGAGTVQRDLGYGNQLPQGMPRPVPQVQQPAPVMPRPVPQVMPRRPTPKPAPQGIARLIGRR